MIGKLICRRTCGTSRPSSCMSRMVWPWNAHNATSRVPPTLELVPGLAPQLGIWYHAGIPNWGSGITQVSPTRGACIFWEARSHVILFPCGQRSSGSLGVKAAAAPAGAAIRGGSSGAGAWPDARERARAMCARGRGPRLSLQGGSTAGPAIQAVARSVSLIICRSRSVSTCRYLFRSVSVGVGQSRSAPVGLDGSRSAPIGLGRPQSVVEVAAHVRGRLGLTDAVRDLQRQGDTDKTSRD